MAASKERVVILGGGVGALSAAVALSEIDPRGEKYDITLYQLGWRLGGKCASGRNAEYGERIDEHGLHVWAGFYDNAFTVMRVVCGALNLPLSDLFERQNLIYYADKTRDGAEEKWEPWPFWFQPSPDPEEFPGRDSLWAPYSVGPSLASLVQRTIGAIIFGLQYYWVDWPGDQDAETRAAIARMPAELRARIGAMPIPATGRSHHPLLELAMRCGAGLESDIAHVRRTAEADVSALLGGFHDLLKPYAGLAPALDILRGLPAAFRHVLTIANLGICIVLGVVRNGCLENGLEAIDDLDFREFLAQQDKAAANNEIVKALYEYIFAYENGSRAQPNVSACSAIQGLYRLYFTYKGAFFFKGLRGMGDIICTPIYQLLKQRGVKFKFFHKVTELQPTDNGSEIGTILIDQQAEVLAGAADYHPFVAVKGFECWPSEPHWAQLKDGEKFKAEGVNFEYAYGPTPQPPPVARLQLRVGEDFDKVILGISVGALADICAPLVRDKTAWKDMVENLATVRTQAFQLWVNRDVDALHEPYVPPPTMHLPAPETVGPIVATCNPPFDTYADMSQVLPAEDWPEPGPRSVAYFCSVMGEEVPNNEELAAQAVKESVQDWMTSWLHNLWPVIGQGDDFRWDLLHASDTLSGPERLDAQFWQANIDPTARYVLSLPGTLKYRMEPGGSGYGNLYLAGDWTRVPEINAGCVEVATMSGIAAASALSGVYIPVASASQERQRSDTYIDYAGWITLPPAPATSNDTTFYTFPFSADPTASQGFLDRSYNRAAGYTRFRVMLDLAFLNIVQVKHTGAPTPPYAAEGTMPEADIGFWLLVGNYEPDAVLPKSIGWVPAYLFVNNGWATVAGREIWGMPKYFANMTLPAAGAPSMGPFEVSALAIKTFSPTAQANEYDLLTLTGTDMTRADPGGPSEKAPGAAAPLDLFKRLCSGADSGLLKALTDNPAMPPFLDAAGVGLPVFYLKQARSADSPTAACYQALLQGPLELTRVHDAGLLPGAWTLALNELDSLPFIRDLGLGTPTDGKLDLTTAIGLWAQIDFVTGLASPMA